MSVTQKKSLTSIQWVLQGGEFSPTQFHEKCTPQRKDPKESVKQYGKNRCEIFSMHMYVPET